MGNSIIFILLGLGYVVGKVLLEKRLAPLEVLQGDHHIANLAYVRGCSVYDIFKAAGVKWNFTAFKMDQDFKRYLQDGFVPQYVRDYTHQEITSPDQTYQTILFSGGRPPYL